MTDRERLDETTDRFARRFYAFPPERDTYAWATLRLNVGTQRSIHAIRRALVPAVVRLNDSMARAAESIRAFTEANR